MSNMFSFISISESMIHVHSLEIEQKEKCQSSVCINCDHMFSGSVEERTKIHTPAVNYKTKKVEKQKKKRGMRIRRKNRSDDICSSSGAMNIRCQSIPSHLFCILYYLIYFYSYTRGSS